MLSLLSDNGDIILHVNDNKNMETKIGLIISMPLTRELCHGVIVCVQIKWKLLFYIRHCHIHTCY